MGASTGTYGSFSVDASGQWTYQLDNVAAQSLKTGDVRTETYTVQVSDGKGGTDSKTVTITINGTNDVPTLGASTSAVTEDKDVVNGKLSVDGAVTITDDDTGESSFQADAVFNGAGAPLGTLVFNTDGTYSYSVDNSLVQYLKTGESVIETYTVTSKDGSATTTITITINGTDDGAVIAPSKPGDDAGQVKEDVTLSASGKLDVTDPDEDQAEFTPVAAHAGQYGDFSIDKNGNWTFDLNNGNVTVQALGVGEHLTDTFTVTTIDGTTAQVTITIDGTNDKPVLSGALTGAVTEDGTQSAMGQLSTTDVDINDTHSYSVVGSATGTYGSFSVDASGQWTYQLDNAAAQSLKAGDVRTETYTVQVSDGKGGTDSKTVTITINGTNDVPTLGASASAVTEDKDVVNGKLSVDGTVTITDDDTGESSFQPDAVFNGAGAPLGTLVFNTDGSYSYSVDNSLVQYLKTGESVVETYTVTSKDGSATTTITITIHGTNDVPTLGASASAVTEDKDVVDGKLSVDGTVTITDDDTGESSFQAGAVFNGAGAPLGTLVFNTDGTYSYSVDNSLVQYLKDGETVVETYTVTSKDGSATTTITITIHGTNDVPTLGASASAVTEDKDVVDGQLVTSGTVTISDDDTGENSFQADAVFNGAGAPLGTLVFNPDGTYSYSVDNSLVQYLKTGESVVETYTVTSKDGSATTTITITINGADDGAIITGNDTANLKEDVKTDASGTLVATGADAGQPQFIEQRDVPVKYGAFTITNDGNWNYRLNNNDPVIQSLGEGQQLTETVTVRTADGTLAEIKVTITGTNDMPQLSQADKSITENPNAAGGVLTAVGTLTISDADAGEAQFQSGAVLSKVEGQFLAANTALGTLTFNADGSYSYSVDNSKVAYLKSGESVVETYTVTSYDGTTTSTIVIRIHGQDSGAVVSPATPGSDKGVVTEDGQLVAGGKLDVTDPDAGEAVFVAQSNVSTTYGQFTIGTDGTWTYTLDNANTAVQALGAGQTLTETREVVTADGTKANVVITINGTNDVPVISGAATGVVTEDGTTAIAGQLTRTDVDATDTHTWSVSNSGQGQYGAFTVDATGRWSYVLDNASSQVQALAAGQQVTDTIDVSVNDGKGGVATQLVTITINGTNDKPTISGVVTGAVQEDVLLTTSGQLTKADVDLNDVHTWSVNNAGKGQYGTFTVDATGKWTYVLDNASSKVQALTEGKKVTDTITVTVNDGKGGTASQTIAVEITGTNEAPVPKAVSGTGPEDNIVAIALLATDADGTVVSFQLTSLPVNGTLYKDAAGTQVLSLQDVLAATGNGATIYFKPNDDWSGTTTFNYNAKDNLGQISTSTATGTITVTPVAEDPVVTIQVGSGSTPVTTVINTSTVNTTSSGHTVTATNASGGAANVSVITGTNHDGFGVSGTATGNTGAASEELAGNGSYSESLTIAFNVPVTRITVQFAWLASSEQARYKMYDEAGNLIKTAIVQGKTDTVEEQFSLTAPVGTTIGSIVFDAPRNGDDYLIHKVTYTTATTYPLTITADPRDLDYSESIVKVVVEVPAGVTLSAGTQIDATHWSLPLTSNGGYSVSVDPITNAVTITGLNMTVPENVTVNEVKVVATAADGSSTATGTDTFHSVPVANDDTATAVLSSKNVTAASTQTTLANFSSNESNAWKFDSSNNTRVYKTNVELSSVTVLKVDMGKWLVSRVDGSTSDATNNGTALVLTDNNGNLTGDARLVTPIYTATAAGTTLQFQVKSLSNMSSSSDFANWALYKSTDGGTTWSAQPAQSGTITGAGTITTSALEVNATYRIALTVHEGSHRNTDAAVTFDDFVAIVPGATSIQWSSSAITGSVTSNDSLGTLGETSTLSVFNGSTWVNASTAGTTVNGAYGTLILKSDGSYTYTPTASAAGAGKVDHFEYKLTQADGDADTANLDISIHATGPGAAQASTFAGMALSSTETSGHEVHGTAGNDTLLGTDEDDLFVWHQGDAGTTARPATDVVKNFGTAGNDALDLADLLQGEETSSDLSKFLHLETRTEADGKTIDTLIKVSTAGTLDADGNGFNQQILLEGVNLTGSSHDQNSMIKDLIDQGKLKIDQSGN
ncbi:VCBS domain-containing protein [Pantoea sp. 18069]|uniref:VCBS domain-containing protein n=1 Tax=Pantoea sp. 18069 TaxID=2681415 RepID=UPI001F368482|nr:VCBS domain-containing protein [Pantoea sp. 18069]